MLIGIAGHKRAGKSTAAAYLHHRYGFVDDSFASPIRALVCAMLGIHLSELERVKEQPIAWLPEWTPRRLMQHLGTEWGRQVVHPDLWVRALLHRVKQFGSTDVVVSDVRFDNEAQAIRNAGGAIIRVHRSATFTADEHGHVSEQPISDEMVDREIVNNGTILHLQDAIDGIIIGLSDWKGAV